MEKRETKWQDTAAMMVMCNVWIYPRISLGSFHVCAILGRIFIYIHYHPFVMLVEINNIECDICRWDRWHTEGVGC